jgi:formylglycine-generating enzyme required for sulfatase activity/energy-coupling factor transporter ATP-binding protein EcfA2
MNPSEFNLDLAVVIGINDYQNGISRLGTAKQDAEAIAAILENDYNYQVHLLKDGQATGQALKNWLETKLPQQLEKDHPSRLVFYFAGHGIALNGDDGPQGYLIPQDAKLGDVATYLPMQQVEAALTKLSCRHCLVILDCCFAGAFRWSSTRKLSDVEETIHKERFDRFIKDPAWQVITSAASDQFALDNLDLNSDRRIAKENSHHSPFAAALMEALRGEADAYPPAKNGQPPGDGIITATELYLYLRDAVEVPTDARNQRQTPQIWCLKKHDKGEFIFLTENFEFDRLEKAPFLDNLEENNPYRGLKSYETKDSGLFFGRTSLIEKLCYTVSDRPLTVVLGASGSGKSSLVKAGLIPSLSLNRVYQWHRLSPIRPGESPLNSLNTVLKELGNVSTDQANSRIFTEAITVWSKANPQTKLLLVVDQLEELITLCRKDDEKQQFLEILATLINTFPDMVRLVVTLRSDFEPQLRNTPLEPLWQAGRFVVPAMTREELRSVIEEPASAKVVYFESLDNPDKSYLVDRLIDEVAGMPGALPLLSFALSELYLKLVRRYLKAQNAGDTVERAITWADYDALGGVTKSLTQRADEIYEELVKVDPAYEKTIRNVMLRMVAVGGELARRQVLKTELEYPEPENTRVKVVLKQFEDARLLTSNKDDQGRPYMEPSHEVLIRGWQKLLTWKKEDDNLSLQRRLTPAAEEWETTKNTNKDQQKGILDKVEPVLDWFDLRLFKVENLLNKIPAWLTRFNNRSENQQGQSREKPAQFLWVSNPYLDLLDQELQLEDNGFNKVEREFIQESALRKRQNISWRWRVMISITCITSYFALNQVVQEIYLKPNEMGRLKVVSLEGKDLSSQTTLIQINNTVEKQEQFFWKVPLFYLDAIPKGLYYVQIKQGKFIMKYPVTIRGFQDYTKPVVFSPYIDKLSANITQNMAFVPKGEFLIGDPSDNTNKQRTHTMVDSFYIDKYEVTNREYEKFIEEIKAVPLSYQIFYNSQPDYKREKDGYTPGDWKDSFYKKYSGNDNTPVINVDWYDAFAYCAWQGKRLPTTLEWEKAASGKDLDGNPKKYAYPWGDDPDFSKANTIDKWFNPNDRTLEMVGTYKAGVSFYGVSDMIGNAFEWVDSWYDEALVNSELPTMKSGFRLQGLKGGSFGKNQFVTPVHQTFLADATQRDLQYGFRCAISRSDDQ